MGKLLGINRSARKHIIASGSPFVPELIELLGSDEWDHFQQFFPAERNDYAHRKLGILRGTAERELEKVQPELKKLLTRIQWLRRYRFGSFIGVRKVRRRGHGYTAQWRSSRGREEDAEGVEIRSERDIPGDEVVLLNPTIGEALVLSPFFLRSDLKGSYQYLWLDGQGLGEDSESVRYRHPTLVAQIEDVRIRIERESVEFAEYRDKPSDWHRIETLELDTDSIQDLLSARFPTSFEESYQEIGLIGQGGMSRVYEVINIALDSRRALKVLTIEQMEASVRSSDSNKRRVSLPNSTTPASLKVWHVGQKDGRPFIEMDLLGRTISSGGPR